MNGPLSGSETTHRYAPINPDGPLPPGFDRDTLGRVLRAVGLKVNQVLRTLGVHNPVLVVHGLEELRRRLDQPAAREKNLHHVKLVVDRRGQTKKGAEPLHQFIYQYCFVRRYGPTPSPRDTRITKVLRKSLVFDNDKSFLDAARFAQKLSIGRAALGLEEQIAPDNDAEALALFGFAFALLQPEAAAPIVDALAALGNDYRAWFGLGELVEEPARDDAPGTPTAAPVDLSEQVPKASPPAPAQPEEDAPPVSSRPEPAAPSTLDELRGAFDECCRVFERVQARLDEGDMPEPQDTSLFEAAKLRARALLVHLSELYGLPADLLRVEKSAFSRRTAADTFLREIEHAVAGALQRDQSLATEEFQRLARECVELDVELPGGADGRTSLSDVRALVQTLGPDLKARRAYRTALADPNATTLAAVVDPATRLRLFSELDTARPDLRTTLPSWLMADPDACAAAPPDALRLLGAGLAAIAEAGIRVPDGAWRAIDRLASTGLADWLIENSMLMVSLATLSDEHLALDALLDVVEPDLDQLLPELSHRLRRHGLRRRPPEERLAGLLGLADGALDSSVAAELLEACLETGRDAGALLVGAFALRTGMIAELPTRFEEAFLTTLVARVRDLPETETVLREFVEGDYGVTEDPDGILVTLFLAHRLDSARDDLLHRHARLVASVTARRPVLVGSVLVPRLRGEPQQVLRDSYDARWTRGRTLLADWRHAMQKTSCYASWDFAKDYQTYFRQLLEARMTQLSAGVAPFSFEPDEWIDEGDRVVGTTVDNTARVNMRRFLREAGQTLEGLWEAGLGRDLTFDALQGPAPVPLPRRLQAEERTAESRPFLREIYAWAAGVAG